MSKVISTCKHCGKKFEMGVNGTMYGCDKCSSTKRDKRGYAWLPDEKTMEVPYIDDGKLKTKTVKRPKGI